MIIIYNYGLHEKLISIIITYFVCPRIKLPVSAQWSQKLYVKVQGKMMHKDMHKIVFQSN